MSGEYYSNQPVSTAFSSKVLTASAADARYEFYTAGFQRLTLDLNYAMGAAETSNKLHFTLEHSPDDGVNWYSLVIDSTSTVSAISPRIWEVTGTSKVNVIVDIAYKKMRLSLYESGVVTNAGTASVTYTLSGL